MALLVRIYYNAVFGALGGLMAWLLIGVLLKATGHQPPDVVQGAAQGIFAEYLPLLLYGIVEGIIIGGSIGFFVVSVDGFRDGSWLRFNRLAAYGLIIGAMGGAIGLPLAEFVNTIVIPWIGEPISKTNVSVGKALLDMLVFGVCWTLVGCGVGVSEGIAARSFGKFSYGTIGGAIGGFIGGGLHCFFLMLNLYYTTHQDIAQKASMSDSFERGWCGLGLVIVGACIGSLTALVQGVMQPACVKVLRGWQEGREYPLIKMASLLGREEHADIALFRDMKVEKRHCFINRVGDRFYLQNNNAPPEYTLVNDEKIRQEVELKEGDKIQLGNILLRFHARAAVNRRKFVGGYQRPKTEITGKRPGW